MRIIVKFFTMFVFTLVFLGLMNGCSSSIDVEEETGPVTAQFIDDPVQGLEYNCSSGTVGVTDTSGEYTCNSDEEVTFYIGGRFIATISVQSGMVTPYTLFPDDLDKALDLARLLQSLDTGETEGVIDLNGTLVADLPDDLDFGSETFESDIEEALEITLVSIEDAHRQLNESISNEGGDVPDVGHAPVANAGMDQDVNTTNTVTLDGSGSYDPDDDSFTYAWSMLSKPSGSNAILLNDTLFNPTFVADMDGSYVMQLIVNDGTVDSTADTVTIVATTKIIHNGTVYGIVKSSHTGRTWLDRNLGASRVCTASNDALCYGDYYQWGRDFDGHEKSNSEVNSTLATDINNVGEDFIIGHDWTTADTSGNLRIAKLAAIDGSSVCPVGFRVPNQTEWANDTINNGVDNRISAFNSFLKLSANGSRNYYNGGMEVQGTTGIYTINAVYDSENVWYFGFNNGSASVYPHTYRAYGRAVRCIKD